MGHLARMQTLPTFYHATETIVKATWPANRLHLHLHKREHDASWITTALKAGMLPNQNSLITNHDQVKDKESHRIEYYL